MRTCWLVALLAPVFRLTAQTVPADTLAYLTQRSSFAKTYFSLEGLHVGGGTVEYLTTEGALRPTDLDSYWQSRLVVGATHFWGHADFYVAFPLPMRYGQTTPAPLQKQSFTQGVETGLRVYPWALEPGRVRPYAGVSFKGVNYAHMGPSSEPGFPTAMWTVFPLHAGLTYASSKFLLQAGSQYVANPARTYYLSRTQV